MSTSTPEQSDIMQLTPKKRALLYADALFAKRRPGIGRSVDEAEVTALERSLTSGEALQAVDRYTTLTGNIELFCGYLDAMLQQFIGEINQVNGLVMLLDTYRKDEQLLTDIINALPNEAKATVVEQVLGKRNERNMCRVEVALLASDNLQITLEPDQFSEVYAKSVSNTNALQVKVKYNIGYTVEDIEAGYYSLEYMLGGWAHKAAGTLAKAKAAIEGIKTAIKEVKAPLQSVKTYLKQMEVKLSTNWATMPQYVDMQVTYLVKDSTRYKHKRDSQYTAVDVVIYPTYEAIEADSQVQDYVVNEIKKGVNG